MSAPKIEKNMQLWDSVSETDPETTRRVTQRGGFTAIDAQAQLKRATAVFGPYGQEWGIREVQYGYVADGDAQPVEITLMAEFYYPGGAFSMSNDMKYRAGDDCRKKLLTDLRSKCLSTLGFNSDVFEGKFDDNKYVSDLKDKRGMDDTYSRAMTALCEADSSERLDMLREHYRKRGLSPEQVTSLDKVHDDRLKEVATGAVHD
tara:strand:- start:256 stop:867 length:612 start_codon:yes stop_codon:yes gene_type:complete